MRHFILLFLFLPCLAEAADIVSVRPVHRALLLLHYDEGRVIYHGNGEDWNDDRIEVDTIDILAAVRPTSYRLGSSDDPDYAEGLAPLNVYRKTKPTEISGICDGWGSLPAYGVDGCLNPDPDRALEHWLYLELSVPLESGKTYTLTVAAAVDGSGETVTFTWNERRTHSEALHVNNLGYATAAPEKFGYLYHWAGDAGGLDFSAYVGQPFHLVAEASGEVAFTGTVTFRKPADNPETNQQDPNETPDQNFLGAAIWECEFSEFSDTGSYRLSVPGVGASFPFEIGCNALRPAHRATMRALYHNRSGIAKTEPYTRFTRPADHHPTETPGFAGRLIYTDFTICEASDLNASGDDRPKWEAGARGALERTFGWYHDAGDWDGYATHLKIPTQLLLTYLYFPENFADDELNIPGSGNGLPDLLDEASWLPRFLQRLRAETSEKGWSTGGVGGARVMGDLWGRDDDADGNGRGSWQDTDRDWYVSGEDVTTTFAYAGMAAQLTHALEQLDVADPGGVDWRTEAMTAYTWAEERYNPALECHDLEAAEKKNYAAAALYQLTGSATYHDAYRASWGQMNTTEGLGEDAGFGAYVYLSLPEEVRDATLSAEVSANIEAFADFMLAEPADRRGARYGGNPWFPMLVGHGTTPMVFEAMMAYGIVRDDSPIKARRYVSALHTTADYFLGTNPLNMTWVTGLGERSPERLFHLDFWYDGHEGIPEGYIPYGPWRRSPGFPNVGPWDIHWPESSLHPAIGEWPGHERWFGQQTAPLSAEFTVHQNIIAGVTLYGLLAGEAGCSDAVVSTRSAATAHGLRIGIYPNPATEAISLEIGDSTDLLRVRVYDSRGRLVRQLGTAHTVDVSGLAGGLYFFEFTAAGGRQVSRVVVR